MANEKRLISPFPIANGIALYVAENAYLNDTALDVLKMVAKWIDEAPTVDAVEVVRCKDCKHYDEQEERCDHPCLYFEYCSDCCLVIKPTDFCSYGERKDNEN